MNFSLEPGGQFRPLLDVEISSMVSVTINILLVVTAILFLLQVLFAGIKMILSGGVKEKTDEAKRQLVNAFVGLLIVFSAWAIASYAGVFFGLDILTLNLPTL